jgi:hypothetical protein
VTLRQFRKRTGLHREKVLRLLRHDRDHISDLRTRVQRLEAALPLCPVCGVRVDPVTQACGCCKPAEPDYSTCCWCGQRVEPGDIAWDGGLSCHKGCVLKRRPVNPADIEVVVDPTLQRGEWHLKQCVAYTPAQIRLAAERYVDAMAHVSKDAEGDCYITVGVWGGGNCGKQCDKIGRTISHATRKLVDQLCVLPWIDWSRCAKDQVELGRGTPLFDPPVVQKAAIRAICPACGAERDVADGDVVPVCCGVVAPRVRVVRPITADSWRDPGVPPVKEPSR